jgi:N-terminal domain of toast_rack, DUF2154
MSIGERRQTVKTKHSLLLVVLCAAVLLAGCRPSARVGALQTESHSVELGDATSVRVEILMGAGELAVSGGAEELLEADFAYNVAELKPEVEYGNDTLTVRQPEGIGLPVLENIEDFQNEWGLRLNDEVPMELTVDMGAGSTTLQLGGLSLTQLEVTLGACEGTVDLTGDWASDLDAVIDVGAANIVVLLPSDVGVRVEVDAGPTAIQTSGLSKDGNVYTNDAYRESAVTVQLRLETGVGRVSLEIVDAG